MAASDEKDVLIDRPVYEEPHIRTYHVAPKHEKVQALNIRQSFLHLLLATMLIMAMVFFRPWGHWYPIVELPIEQRVHKILSGTPLIGKSRGVLLSRHNLTCHRRS
jgi:hypothetical protein